VVSVTVLDDNAALADAASTALFIAGPEKLDEVASGLGVNAIMMIDDEHRIYMTLPMKRRVSLEDTDRNREIVTVQLTGNMTNED
jgi:thiamine biosynthesis lipoprotein